MGWGGGGETEPWGGGNPVPPPPPRMKPWCLSCCTSKIVSICQYACRNDLMTNKLTICWKGKQSLQYAKGRNQCRNNVNDSFRKGFHELKYHVLNRLMTGRWPRKSLQLWPKFHSLFLQKSFDFQKSATLKGLKSSPRMYWCNLQPWKRRLLQNQKVTQRHTDLQSDYCNPLAHARWGLIKHPQNKHQ